MIKRAERADLARIERTVSRAFIADPIARWMLPTDDEYERLGTSFFGLAVRRWMAAGEVWTTPDVVAAAAWAPPEPRELHASEAGELGTLFARFDESYHSKFEAIGRWMAANRPAEPHWYLNVLATHPDWQGQGLGREVTSAIHTRADADGLHCYLETETEKNVSIYHRMGYVVRTEWNLDLADGTPGPHMWGMLRAPR